MKMPKLCPGCQKPIAKITGAEQTALVGTVRYHCGTVFGLYDAMVQVSNPCFPTAQWNSHEGFVEMVRLRTQLREQIFLLDYVTSRITAGSALLEAGRQAWEAIDG